MTPSKMPNASRLQYFFKYGQQNEYNLEMFDTSMSRPRATSAAFQTNSTLFFNPKLWPTPRRPVGVAIWAE
jgi:hypothetical protein